MRLQRVALPQANSQLLLVQASPGKKLWATVDEIRNLDFDEVQVVGYNAAGHSLLITSFLN